MVAVNKNIRHGERMLLYHGSKVANDTVMPTIQAFLSGFLNEEAAIITLKTSKLVDQICLKSEKALSLLRFVKSYNTERGENDG